MNTLLLYLLMAIQVAIFNAWMLWDDVAMQIFVQDICLRITIPFMLLYRALHLDAFGRAALVIHGIFLSLDAADYILNSDVGGALPEIQLWAIAVTSPLALRWRRRRKQQQEQQIKSPAN